MPVSVIEAALAGAAFTALGSTITGLVVQRSNGYRDHLVRLWERQAEVYEKILAALSDKRFTRAGVMEVINSKTGNTSKLAEVSEREIPDILADSTLVARVMMFGSREVLKKYTEYSDKNRYWERTLSELQAPVIGKYQVFTDSMLIEIREVYKDMSQAEVAVMERIRGEIRDTPGPRRRWGVFSAGRYRG